MSNKSPFDAEIEKIKKAKEKAVLESLLMIEADAKLMCPVNLRLNVATH